MNYSHRVFRGEGLTVDLTGEWEDALGGGESVGGGEVRVEGGEGVELGEADEESLMSGGHELESCERLNHLLTVLKSPPKPLVILDHTFVPVDTVNSHIE